MDVLNGLQRAPERRHRAAVDSGNRVNCSPTEVNNQRGSPADYLITGDELKKVFLKFQADNPWFIDKTGQVGEVDCAFDVIFISDIPAE